MGIRKWLNDTFGYTIIEPDEVPPTPEEIEKRWADDPSEPRKEE